MRPVGPRSALARGSAALALGAALCAGSAWLALEPAWGPQVPWREGLELALGRGPADAVASVVLRLEELGRLALAAAGLALWAACARRSPGGASAVRKREAWETAPDAAHAPSSGPGALGLGRAEDRRASLPAGTLALEFGTVLLAAAWADLAWLGWPEPEGWAPVARTLLCVCGAALGARLAARRGPRAAAGLALLLLAGLGQQLARPAVELDALRSLERLLLGDATRALAPAWALVVLLGLALALRGFLGRALALAAAALACGGLWGLAAFAALGPRWAPAVLVPVALAGEALAAQWIGWGRLAPGVPGALAAGGGLLAAGLLGLGREGGKVRERS